MQLSLEGLLMKVSCPPLVPPWNMIHKQCLGLKMVEHSFQ